MVCARPLSIFFGNRDRCTMHAIWLVRRAIICSYTSNSSSRSILRHHLIYTKVRLPERVYRRSDERSIENAARLSQRYQTVENIRKLCCNKKLKRRVRGISSSSGMLSPSNIDLYRCLHMHNTHLFRLTLQS